MSGTTRPPPQSRRSLRARPRPWPSSPASARPALQEEGGQERGGEGGSGGRAGEGRERAPEAAAGTVALVAVRCHRQSPPEPQSGGMAVSVPVGQPGQWSGHSWRPGRCRSSCLTQGGWEGTAPGTAPGKGTFAPRVSPVMGGGAPQLAPPPPTSRSIWRGRAASAGAKAGARPSLLQTCRPGRAGHSHPPAVQGPCCSAAALLDTVATHLASDPHSLLCLLLPVPQGLGPGSPSLLQLAQGPVCPRHPDVTCG